MKLLNILKNKSVYIYLLICNNIFKKIILFSKLDFIYNLS
ncbi:hypothetical protein HMPREF1123_02869 [Clostridioides difficile 050-P50-2011]|nr:hypothetical protein HMPREF1123_02869 [Clostridioides difficile 050-P50-2011]